MKVRNKIYDCFAEIPEKNFDPEIHERLDEPKPKPKAKEPEAATGKSRRSK